MNKLLPALIIALYICIPGHLLQAQDPIFSQYFANPIYLNPALTGMYGGTNVSLNGQKLRYKAGSFHTNSMSVSMDVPCIQSAFGVMYSDDRAGDSPVKWQRAGLAWAWYAVPSASPEDRWDLRFGLNGSYNRRTLGRGDLIFSDQLDALEGYLGPSMLNLDGFGGDNAFFDLDAGLDLWFEMGQSGWSQNLGLVANHLVLADPSLLNTNDTLPIRYTAYWQTVLHSEAFKHHYWFMPMVKVEHQRASRHWSLKDSTGVNQVFNALRMWRLSTGIIMALAPRRRDSDRQNVGFWGGAFHHFSRIRTQTAGINGRDINTLSFMLGFNWDTPGSDWRIGLSYDYDYRGTRSDTGGIFELSMMMSLPDGGLFCPSGSERSKRKCPVPTARSSKYNFYRK